MSCSPTHWNKNVEQVFQCRQLWDELLDHFTESFKYGVVIYTCQIEAVETKENNLNQDILYQWITLILICCFIYGDLSLISKNLLISRKCELQSLVMPCQHHSLNQQSLLLRCMTNLKVCLYDSIYWILTENSLKVWGKTHLRCICSKLASARSTLTRFWMSLCFSILWSSDRPSTLWMKTSKLMSGLTL